MMKKKVMIVCVSNDKSIISIFHVPEHGILGLSFYGCMLDMSMLQLHTVARMFMCISSCLVNKMANNNTKIVSYNTKTIVVVLHRLRTVINVCIIKHFCLPITQIKR